MDRSAYHFHTVVVCREHGLNDCGPVDDYEKAKILTQQVPSEYEESAADGDNITITVNARTDELVDFTMLDENGHEHPLFATIRYCNAPIMLCRMQAMAEVTSRLQMLNPEVANDLIQKAFESASNLEERVEDNSSLFSSIEDFLGGNDQQQNGGDSLTN